MEPTNICIECDREFTADNPCCCDYATHDNGYHVDGVCVECCKPNHGYAQIHGMERE